MLWYRQARGSTAMALIGHGYSYGDQNYEADFSGGRFDIKREGAQKGSLVLSNLTSSDSAVYFCAASSTVLQMTAVLSLKTLIRGVLCNVDTYGWSGNCVKFLQSPNILAKYESKEEIFCNHDDNGLLVMLWYRQASGSTAMALIASGYSNSDPSYEADFSGGRFELYKFLQEHGFKLMVHSYQAGYLDPEPDFETGFEFERPTVLELRLKIQSVKLEDTALYFCAARYAHTEADTAVCLIHSFKLQNTMLFVLASLPLLMQIVYGLTINQSPSSVTVYPGHRNLQLNCYMPSMGSYTMMWYRQKSGDGAAIEFLMKEYESPTGHLEVTLAKTGNTFSLDMYNVTMEDSGTYYCAASAELSGSSNPVINQTVQDLLITPGQTMSIPCYIKDMASYTMTWYRQPVWGRSLDYIVDEEGKVYSNKLGSRFTVNYKPEQDLIFLNTSQLGTDDSARYYCATGHLASDTHKGCTRTCTEGSL
ncbi:hypothetical protein ACEWY4_005774 [Coilia grayii]|uniref:Ig-like domain-containing protein n=1 Tax=Coilia grayii TaxID=363190 RepID=A0ABD1KJE8_9TELE